MLTVTVAALV